MTDEPVVEIQNEDVRNVNLTFPDLNKLDLSKIKKLGDVVDNNILRAEALQGRDYLNTPIYVHDWDWFEHPKFGKILCLSVVIPASNEWGQMNVSSVYVLKVFEGLDAIGAQPPFTMQFEEKGEESYKVKLD